ncbi:MAG: hypothetical protein RL268_654 [Pseudomonadota bacterium]
MGLFFLPAFVRLLGYLVIGLWIVPALFAASLSLLVLGAYDLGPSYAAELMTAGVTSFSGPVSAHLAARAMKLREQLENLSPLRLLLLSGACSLGNSLGLGSALWLVSAEDAFNPWLFKVIFLGDMIGTWLLLYLLKFALEAALLWQRK